MMPTYYTLEGSESNSQKGKFEAGRILICGSFLATFFLVGFLTGVATENYGVPASSIAPSLLRTQVPLQGLHAVAADVPLSLDTLSSRRDRPIVLPDKVKVTRSADLLTVEGPKGKLTRSIPKEVTLRQENGILLVTFDETKRNSRAFFGLHQALIKNMVIGVTQEFTKKMEMIGVGYRAKVDGKNLVLNVGKSHDVIMPIPDGVKVTVEDNTKLSITSIDNEKVGQFCADVRMERPPEPYKGKGIRFQDEQIILKAGKSGKK